MSVKTGIKKFVCDSDGQFKPPYFWATLFLALFAVTVVIQILMTVESYRREQEELNLSLVPLAGVLASLAAAMVAVYNQGKKNRRGDEYLPPHYPDDIENEPYGGDKSNERKL